MSSWTSFAAGLRAAAVLGLALLPMAHPRRAEAPGSCAAPELALDVDGDGRADRVRWVRADGAYWIDVALAADSDGDGDGDRHGASDGPRGGDGDQGAAFNVRSTTRVADADADADAGGRWVLRAVDLNGDGKMDLLVGDAHGHTTAFVSDGVAFSAAPAPAALTTGAAFCAG